MSSVLPFTTAERIAPGNASLSESLIAGDFYNILTSQAAQTLFEQAQQQQIASDSASSISWPENLGTCIKSSVEDASIPVEQSQALAIIGAAALHAFLQANVTGPPLGWRSEEVLYGFREQAPGQIHSTSAGLASWRAGLVSYLTSDGIAAYHLTPNVELFVAAQVLLNHPSVCPAEGSLPWARLRVNFWHQRLLNEASDALQKVIYNDVRYLDYLVLNEQSGYSKDQQVEFLLEKAAINTFHLFDDKARDDLQQATRIRGFEYVLTGRLGKRTKFQQNEISQLVVLAKSADADDASTSTRSTRDASETATTVADGSKPENLKLNDDTLLESIAFSSGHSGAEIDPKETLPPSLAALDPSNQPALAPLDSIILLLLASSITNTSPENGLTREETLPYATRVIDGGSTNWQIYSQALLVRSRIEGHKSRTVERGVLQLQALVDQVLAETTEKSEPSQTASTGTDQSADTSATTFLPKPKASESASVTERLQFIHQMASPARWTLEAELASRWVQLGGLRTALEIYERLEMWAEAALCWAATDREDTARRIVRRQLYLPQDADQDGAEGEEYNGPERQPLPADAPRLLCILGDIEKAPALYERAWDVSKKRYGRAQRSLGKHYLSTGKLAEADEAYSLSLRTSPQDRTAWFSLGCVRLETRNWKGAVEAFSRVVQLESEDAEAWSNLAAAFLRLPTDQEVASLSDRLAPDEDEEVTSQQPKSDAQKNAKQALIAFKRAARLKRDSYRIWQNLLNVAATLSPPPYTDIVLAQQRLIELRGDTEGEGCVDVEVLEGLLTHVIAEAAEASDKSADTAVSVNNGDAGRRDAAEAIASNEVLNDATTPSRKHGLQHMFTELMGKHIVPLITHSRRLWQLVARFSIFLKRPSAALDAYEKAWRCTLNQPGWDDEMMQGGGGTGGESQSVAAKAWTEVEEATTELVDAYESLGEREVTEGLKAGSGELVCRNWRYKARMAIRSVLGRRAKAGGEGVQGLQGRMEELKM